MGVGQENVYAMEEDCDSFFICILELMMDINGKPKQLIHFMDSIWCFMLLWTMYVGWINDKQVLWRNM